MWCFLLQVDSIAILLISHTKKCKFYRRVPLLFLIYFIVYSYMLNKQLVCNHVKNCLKTPSIITVKLKKISKQEVFFLPRHSGLYLKKKLKFSKNFSQIYWFWINTLICVKKKFIALCSKSWILLLPKIYLRKLKFFTNWKCAIKVLFNIYRFK